MKTRLMWNTSSHVIR